MESFFNNRNLVNMVFKWKYHLIIIAFLAAVVSAFLSSPTFIDPMYKSTAIVYPVNLGEKSEESDTEQMLEIIQSNYISEKLYDVFDLGKHYEIDPDFKYYRTALDGEFSSNVSFRKTENDAVKITVFDKDPKIACNIIDSLISFYNDKVASLHREKQLEVVTITKIQVKQKSSEIDSIKNKLIELGKNYGLTNLDVQTESAARAYYKMLSKGQGNSMEAKEIKTQIRNLEEYGPDYLILKSELINERVVLDGIKLAYETALKEYNKSITYAQIVTNPFPADKKSSPVRSLIVLITVLLTMVVALIVIGFIESIKKV